MLHHTPQVSGRFMGAQVGQQGQPGPFRPELGGLFVRDDLLGARDDPVVSDDASGQDGLLGVPDGELGSGVPVRGKGAALQEHAAPVGQVRERGPLDSGCGQLIRRIQLSAQGQAVGEMLGRPQPVDGGIRVPGEDAAGGREPLEVERALVDGQADRPGGGRGPAARAELRVTPIEIEEGREPGTALAHRPPMRPERPEGLGEPRSAPGVRPLLQQVQCGPEIGQFAVGALEPAAFGRGVGAVDGALGKVQRPVQQTVLGGRHFTAGTELLDDELLQHVEQPEARGVGRPVHGLDEVPVDQVR